MSATDREFSESDVDKTVVASDGRDLGVVREVRSGVAFVDPMESLEPTLRSQLGWGGDGRDQYRLDESRVETVDGDEIHLSEP